MVTFEQSLSTSVYTEILDGNSYLAFDILRTSNGKAVEIYFNESDTAPTAGGILVQPRFNESTILQNWDFEGEGFDNATQRVWVRGSGTIRGVRG